MKTQWDKVFSEERFGTDLQPRQFVVKHMKDWPREKGPILDVGCGCGRHVIHLASRGYDVYGLDISLVALKRTRERLAALGLSAHLTKAPMWEIPFGDQQFSAVLCMSVINHGTNDEVLQTVKEIAKRLDSSGLLLVTSLTLNDYKAEGNKVGPTTYICNEGPERGILHTLFSEDAIAGLLAPYFTVDEVEVTHYQHLAGERKTLHGEQLWIKATRK